MEFLKELFGEESLTYGQLAEKLKDSETVKLGNLAGGAYVGAEKFKALETERDDLRERLSKADTAIADFQKMDIDGIKAAAEQYKADSETAQKAADERVSAAERRMAATEAASKHTFTSNSARTAYINALVDKGLPLENGAFTGATEFDAAYKETDPDAFQTDVQAPKFVAPTKPPAKGVDWRDRMQDNYKKAIKGE